MYYIQCEIQKPTENGTKIIDISWIPEKFAKIGNVIKIKKDNIWDEGWEITKIYSKQEKKYIEDKERDYLKQRKVSDV